MPTTALPSRPAARAHGGRIASWVAVMLLASAPTWAGPPLVTDDPVPTAWRHWEIVTPWSLERAAGEDLVEFPGLDANYGGGPDLQLTLGAGIEWTDPFSRRARAHLGGIELAAKMRFLTAGREAHQAQLAVFPRIIVPDDGTWRDPHPDYQWPLVWLQELGPRTRAYGDVHVTTTDGAGRRNPLFVGLALEQDLNPRWTLTGEVFRQGAESASDPAVGAFNLGFFRMLARSPTDEDSGVALLFAAGRSLTASPRVTVYVGPRFTFRSPGH